jgi:pantoate--beta-alanine ligase
VIEIDDLDAMRRWSRTERGQGRTVGFVPTMGFFHAGHLALIDRARRRADRVVVSIFVNPIQFGPREDLAAYPRDLERDRAAAAAHGVDCLFVPDDAAMYPAPAVVRVVPGSLADHLCGASRPGHFEGVLTVVMKLFNVVEPDLAVFGRKDAQQAIAIRRMVADLNLPVEIDVAPTVREPDGLAMSSRNAYLSPEERRVAPTLARALDAAHDAFRSGERSREGVLEAARAAIPAHPQLALEYLEIVDPATLAPAEAVEASSIVAVAARLGKARLIDNIVLGDGTAGDVRAAP